MTETRDKINILAKSNVFKDLPHQALESIAQSARDLVVPQHTMIFRKGDAGDSLYIIYSGQVRIFVRDEHNIEVDLSYQGAGETFGEMSLLTGEPRSADVEVVEETHLLVLSRNDFDRILKDYPDVSKTFMKQMRRWIMRSGERLEMEAREAYKASRVSWVDYLVVLAVSVLLGLVFNASNPNGVPLFPSIPDQNAFGTVSPATVMEELSRGEAIILDAMPNNFFKKRHIKGAINMPLGLFDIVYMMTFSEEQKDRKIVVYGGTISKPYDLEVANKLMLRGYQKVRILEGGLKAWESQGYPVEEMGKK